MAEGDFQGPSDRENRERRGRREGQGRTCPLININEDASLRLVSHFEPVSHIYERRRSSLSFKRGDAARGASRRNPLSKGNAPSFRYQFRAINSARIILSAAPHRPDLLAHLCRASVPAAGAVFS